jgi:hypothetical protein
MQDFSANSATPSQTDKAGQTTGAYQLRISPAPAGSSFPNLVTLSCPTGLRSGAQCRFTPKVIIPVATLPGGDDPLYGATSGSFETQARCVCIVAGSARDFGDLRFLRWQHQRGAVGSMFVLHILISTSSCGGGAGNSADGGGGGGQQKHEVWCEGHRDLWLPHPPTTVDPLLRK